MKNAIGRSPISASGTLVPLGIVEAKSAHSNSAPSAAPTATKATAAPSQNRKVGPGSATFQIIDGFRRCRKPSATSSGVSPEHWRMRPGRRARSVAHGRVGRELADLLCTAAGGGDLGGPLERLLECGNVDDRDSG